MTFGNPFGLALYDKTQANVETDAPARRDDAALAYICKAKSDLQCYSTPGEVRAWWESEAKERERNGVTKGTKAFDELWDAFCTTGKKLASKQEAA
jgi:hypothetical protein